MNDASSQADSPKGEKIMPSSTPSSRAFIRRLLIQWGRAQLAEPQRQGLEHERDLPAEAEQGKEHEQEEAWEVPF
jgi:hypothetical protein